MDYRNKNNKQNMGNNNSYESFNNPNNSYVNYRDEEEVDEKTRIIRKMRTAISDTGETDVIYVTKTLTKVGSTTTIDLNKQNEYKPNHNFHINQEQEELSQEQNYFNNYSEDDEYDNKDNFESFNNSNNYDNYDYETNDDEQNNNFESTNDNNEKDTKEIKDEKKENSSDDENKKSKDKSEDDSVGSRDNLYFKDISQEIGINVSNLIGKNEIGLKIKNAYEELNTIYKDCINKLAFTYNVLIKLQKRGFKYNVEKLSSINESQIVKLKYEFRNWLNDNKEDLDYNELYEAIILCYHKLANELSILEKLNDDMNAFIASEPEIRKEEAIKKEKEEAKIKAKKKQRIILLSIIGISVLVVVGIALVLVLKFVLKLF